MIKLEELDIQGLKTLATGCILNYQEVANEKAQSHGDWRETYKRILLPFIGVMLLGNIFFYAFYAEAGFLFIIPAIGVMFLAPLIAMYVLAYTSAYTQGKQDLNASMMCFTLSYIPAAAASIFMVIPIVGTIIAMGGALYGLFILYQIIPTFLSVPDEKRLMHFGMFIVVFFVAAAILQALLTLLV